MSGSGERLEVRPPAVAGSFYPAQPEALRGAVDRLLAQALRHRSTARCEG